MQSRIDLTRCKELTKLVKESVEKEHYTDHRVITKTTDSGNRTTVGIAYNSADCKITGTLVGGPAFNSQKIHKGDVIVGIDGVKCKGNEKNVDKMLGGADQPGSVVVMEMQREGSKETVDVKLQRMAVELIVDKRKV